MIIKCVGFFLNIHEFTFMCVYPRRRLVGSMCEPKRFDSMAHASSTQGGPHVPVFDSSLQVSGVSFSYLTFAIIYLCASYFFTSFNSFIIYKSLYYRVGCVHGTLLLLVMYKWFVSSEDNSRTLENIFVFLRLGAVCYTSQMRIGTL